MLADKLVMVTAFKNALRSIVLTVSIRVAELYDWMSAASCRRSGTTFAQWPVFRIFAVDGNWRLLT